MKNQLSKIALKGAAAATLLAVLSCDRGRLLALFILIGK
jgi:hypothetical protein